MNQRLLTCTHAEEEGPKDRVSLMTKPASTDGWGAGWKMHRTKRHSRRSDDPVVHPQGHPRTNHYLMLMVVIMQMWFKDGELLYFDESPPW
mmetsp:Transcript_33053/g.59181  ORF Transcript_33053/g.59181 Transcript_33053/m.59181 type:complete len:91 (+) Transcript_33053:1026-1298(+)